MSTEDWKLQVSYKTPSGDMVNIRANTADELSVLLEGIGDYSTQIAAVQKLITGAYTVAPLSTPASTPVSPVAPTSMPDQTAGQSPTCIHGARKFLSGVSKKTGRPYKMWVCPQPQGAEQCSIVNA